MLGIGKKSAQDGQESGSQDAAEVPEELPDLPEQPENSPESSIGDAVPDELPPADLAPDELPPVDDAAAAPDLSHPGDDKRLYFSSLLQKIHEEGLKSTKLMVPTANLLSDMKKHWKEQKRTEEVDAMMQKVTESLTPLQRLEKEWVALNDDIEQKKQLLRQKEAEIQKLAEEARLMAAQAERMKSKCSKL